jgi:exodeoxyribonuclease V alpha subunit
MTAEQILLSEVEQQKSAINRPLLFSLLASLEKQQCLRVIDVKFCRWLAEKLPQSSNRQLLLCAIVSSELGDGHVCINTDQLSAIVEHWPSELAQALQNILLVDSSSEPLVDGILIGDGSSITPLVKEANRLYLYRYWRYEEKVANALLKSKNEFNSGLDNAYLKAQLDKYFTRSQTLDWQRIAAAITTKHSISIISGGPGTGKTTTVTKLLAIYIEGQLQLGRNPIIQLAAPTGKAAARLSESIAAAKKNLPLSSQIFELIPDQGKTLHRLLGARPASNKFIHHQDNPLLADLVIIDEASMIDLPMMASIVDALSDQTRLILIGDRDQLASVEAGSVLGDICASPQMGRYSKQQAEQLKQSCGFSQAKAASLPFADQLAFLHKSYRFSENSGIGALAKACNLGNARQVEQILTTQYADIEHLSRILINQESLTILQSILEAYKDYIQAMTATKEPQELLKKFGQFQVLCALRIGNWGVEKINQLIEHHFELSQLKEVDNRWYAGRPIMITRNDNAMRLYNGDIGVTCLDTQTQQLKVWFEQAGELRGILPSRLPQHETVFAMTVHKSQGSEFNHVMFILGQETKVVNRELVYTAITRAKQRFSYVGTIRSIKQAVLRSTQRASGLASKIWLDKARI